MANPEHLKILKQSIEDWNQWRANNPYVRPDLSWADLSGENLSGANFSRTDLSLVNFFSTVLREADFSAANLTGANLIAAELDQAILTGACLKNWNTDSMTSLEGVVCEYFYLIYEKELIHEGVSPEGDIWKFEGWFGERCPSMGSFQSGEFTKLFQSDYSCNKLSILEALINRFERLLDEYPQGHESLFHKFLIKNPVLLDVYGEPDSKPKFPFPKGESPLEKEYVEPDVIIKYPNNKYKLIELERPNKHWGTKQGQTTSELNQAAFQACSEWDYYIRNHYDLIKDKYPGISNHRSYMVVIGRKTQANVGGRNPEEYRQYIAGQYPCEVCFYDDLLDKAKQSFRALTALLL
jgi:hypothetical protein